MQIVYFPYLNLKDIDSIRLGDMEIWNLDRKAEEYIPDINLREKITKLLKSNVKRNTPIKNIGVFSIGENDFRELTSKEINAAHEAKLLSFLAFISRVNIQIDGPNAGHYIATSENFSFVIQNFSSTQDWIAQQSGFIAQRLDGGYKIGKLLFHAPPYVPDFMRFRSDDDLIIKLIEVKQKRKRTYDRFLRASELVFQSYFNDPYVSLNSRLLLQVSAFEILLDLSDQSQRKDFKQKIKKYAVKSTDRTRTFISERFGGKTKQEVGNVREMWADKFYTLRNHIIHGNKVKNSEFLFNKQSHLDLGPMFFILMLKMKINEVLKDKYFLDSIIWKKVRDEHENFNYWKFIYADQSIYASFLRQTKRDS